MAARLALGPFALTLCYLLASVVVVAFAASLPALAAVAAALAEAWALLGVLLAVLDVVALAAVFRTGVGG